MLKRLLAIFRRKPAKQAPSEPATTTLKHSDIRTERRFTGGSHPSSHSPSRSSTSRHDDPLANVYHPLNPINQLHQASVYDSEPRRTCDTSSSWSGSSSSYDSSSSSSDSCSSSSSSSSD